MQTSEPASVSSYFLLPAFFFPSHTSSLPNKNESVASSCFPASGLESPSFRHLLSSSYSTSLTFPSPPLHPFLAASHVRALQEVIHRVWLHPCFHALVGGPLPRQVRQEEKTGIMRAYTYVAGGTERGKTRV